MIPVHADGGRCHGTALEITPSGGRYCPGCGITPDTQSTELWSDEQVYRSMVDRALAFVDENGYADPEQCKLLVREIRMLRMGRA